MDNKSYKYKRPFASNSSVWNKEWSFIKAASTLKRLISMTISRCNAHCQPNMTHMYFKFVVFFFFGVVFEVIALYTKEHVILTHVNSHTSPEKCQNIWNLNSVLLTAFIRRTLKVSFSAYSRHAFSPWKHFSRTNVMTHDYTNDVRWPL